MPSSAARVGGCQFAFWIQPPRKEEVSSSLARDETKKRNEFRGSEDVNQRDGGVAGDHSDVLRAEDVAVGKKWQVIRESFVILFHVSRPLVALVWTI